MNVTIIKYNAGNIYSVDYALKRLGITPVITADPELIRKADKVIFPGVGEAFTTMEYLKAHQMTDLICGLKQPVLGICLGMQLMCLDSQEGDVECLGIFDAHVKKFEATADAKVPHMGWNSLGNLDSRLFRGLKSGSCVYFVHSYFADLCSDTIATCRHGDKLFSAALKYENFYGTQFHPEKSGSAGEAILKNFIGL